MEILASSKTGAAKYDLLENDPLKVLTRLDARQLAEALQYLAEVTQGYSLSGDEGSSDALVTNLSIINTSNIATYKPKLTQELQTLIAHQNTLAVDGTTTANAIVLVPKKISADAAPNAVNYTIVAPLPLKWQDDLQFTFRATIANTTATTLSIPSLSGLSGAVDLLDESGSALVGGEITIGKYITVVTKTISGNKKFLLRKDKKLVAFRAFRNTSTQTIAAGTATKVQLNAETFDTNGYFDSATNYRFTPLIAGYYQFFGICNITGITGNRLESMIYKNGSKTASGSSVSGTGDMVSVVSDLIYMNGSTDYVELYVVQYSSDGNESLQNGSGSTFLCGNLIS